MTYIQLVKRRKLICMLTQVPIELVQPVSFVVDKLLKLGFQAIWTSIPNSNLSLMRHFFKVVENFGQMGQVGQIGTCGSQRKSVVPHVACQGCGGSLHPLAGLLALDAAELVFKLGLAIRWISCDAMHCKFKSGAGREIRVLQHRNLGRFPPVFGIFHQRGTFQLVANVLIEVRQRLCILCTR